MGAGSVSLDPLADGVPTLVQRLRRVHQKMVDAALVGDGFDRMAELAAEEASRPVAIVVPALETALVWPGGHAAELGELCRFAAARVRGEPAEIPAGVDLLVPIAFGDEIIGSVAMLAGTASAPAEAGEFLHLAATAAATAFALEEARERETHSAGVVEGVLRGALDVPAAVRRAAADGCDLSAGLAVCATEVRSSRRAEALAVAAAQAPGSLGELVGTRLYVLLPVGGGDREKLADRLRAYGPTAVSSSYADPADLSRALHEAELMLEVLARDGETAREIESGTGSEVYRLLFRVLASHPEEVMSFYEDTVAPVARYDDQYRGDLVSTLEAYLGNDCNMNATARAIYAHRHTVAYRLERIKELTGLDPAATEDRERLGLGLKALRIVEPDLPR
jgi:PucR C-terminal helix-turn-helix domain/GGDEF-like domain